MDSDEEKHLDYIFGTGKQDVGRKALICGDRNWTEGEPIRAYLCKLQDWGFSIIIEGEAPGADILAREEAEQMGFTVMKFPAHWEKYGRAAGPIRNREMLDQQPALVIAFHDNPSQSKGTRDTVEEAMRRGIQVIVYPERR